MSSPNCTFGSRLMDRKPLQIVATMKVTKLNQIVGMLKMFKIEIFLSTVDEEWRSREVLQVTETNVGQWGLEYHLS